jgi:hypothetical protein
MGPVGVPALPVTVAVIVVPPGKLEVGFDDETTAVELGVSACA